MTSSQLTAHVSARVSCSSHVRFPSSAAGVAGGSIVQGVLRVGDEIEVRPGIVTKDEGNVRVRMGLVFVHMRSAWSFARFGGGCLDFVPRGVCVVKLLPLAAHVCSRYQVYLCVSLVLGVGVAMYAPQQGKKRHAGESTNARTSTSRSFPAPPPPPLDLVCSVNRSSRRSCRCTRSRTTSSSRCREG